MNGLAEQVPLSGPVGSPSPETGLTLRHALLFALGYAPLLVAFFLNLWARPHYQFFPLALAGAAFLAWTRLKDLRNRPPADGPRRSPLVTCHSPPATGHLPLALLAVSFLVLVTATLYWSPWLGSLAAIIGLIAVIWLVGGKQRLQALAPALVLGLVIIPPPLALDVRFADSLRVLAVNWSSHLLDLLSVTHSQSGNIIELPTQKLLVEEACSGINSVLITLAGCLFYMLWRRASIICTVISLVGTVSFVLLGNVGRITLGAWLKFRHGIEILSGWPHQLVGLLLFAMYMVLIFSLDRWLVFLTSPLPSRKRQRPPGAAQPPSASLPPQPATSNLQPATPAPSPLSPLPSSFSLLPSPGWTQVVICAFALLGMLGVGRGWIHHRQEKAQPAIPNSALQAGATFALPEQIGAWQRLNSESPALQKVETLGVFSQVWHFQRKQVVASVALDYPFAGYHDVTLCYTLRGWKVLDRFTAPANPAKNSPACAEARLHNDLGLYGSLWFSTVDDRGHWLETPVLQREFLDRWKVPWRTEPTTYRVQALVAGYTPLPAPEQQQVKELFEQARALLWQQLAAQMRHQP
jgi:exosortase